METAEWLITEVRFAGTGWERFKILWDVMGMGKVNAGYRRDGVGMGKICREWGQVSVTVQASNMGSNVVITHTLQTGQGMIFGLYSSTLCYGEWQYKPIMGSERYAPLAQAFGTLG